MLMIIYGSGLRAVFGVQCAGGISAGGIACGGQSVCDVTHPSAFVYDAPVGERHRFAVYPAAVGACIE